MGAAAYRVDTDEIAAEVIGGEAVILNLSSGVYHNLDGAGGLAWSLIARGHTVDSVGAELADRYGIEREAATADVATLCEELRAQGLIVPAGNGAEPECVPDHELPPDGPYVVPVLETHTDMGDLLALDPPMPGVKQVPWRPTGE